MGASAWAWPPSASLTLCGSGPCVLPFSQSKAPEELAGRWFLSAELSQGSPAEARHADCCISVWTCGKGAHEGNKEIAQAGTQGLWESRAGVLCSDLILPSPVRPSSLWEFWG